MIIGGETYGIKVVVLSNSAMEQYRGHLSRHSCATRNAMSATKAREYFSAVLAMKQSMIPFGEQTFFSLFPGDNGASAGRHSQSSRRFKAHAAIQLW